MWKILKALIRSNVLGWRYSDRSGRGCTLQRQRCFVRCHGFFRSHRHVCLHLADGEWLGGVYLRSSFYLTSCCLYPRCCIFILEILWFGLTIFQTSSLWPVRSAFTSHVLFLWHRYVVARTGPGLIAWKIVIIPLFSDTSECVIRL